MKTFDDLDYAAHRMRPVYWAHAEAHLEPSIWAISSTQLSDGDTLFDAQILSSVTGNPAPDGLFYEGDELIGATPDEITALMKKVQEA